LLVLHASDLSAESQLSARLDKRRAELERAEKRLATLAGVRPAYMDEYEALTGQMQVGLQLQLWLADAFDASYCSLLAAAHKLPLSSLQ
jgi:hypothetical protein